MKPIIKKYDTSKYPFKKFIQDIFQCNDLKNIHVLRKDLLPNSTLTFLNESRTKFHQRFYNIVNNGLPNFHRTYYSFIKNEIVRNTGNDILYQYQPTFRVHLPGDKAIHKWHYDSDIEHHHLEGEINFQIGITETFGNNALWIESEIGKKDYTPIELFYGEYAQFNGNKLTHGNKINDTNRTRISFDFRILPIAKYKYNKEKLVSITSNTKFEIGGYYRKYEG